MIQIGLLVVAVAAILARPWHLPVWVGPAIAAAVALATGAAKWSLAVDTGRVLRDPLLFLLFAVPLAVLLDRLGFFRALAARLDGRDRIYGELWVLAVAVVVVFNLDAAVVLLTPLYIRIARRDGLDQVALAFQPAILACLASGVLPVSNLTNLLAAESLDLHVADFLGHLALPALAAVTVGWFCYRAVLVRPALRSEAVERAEEAAARAELRPVPPSEVGTPGEHHVPGADDRRALGWGAAVVVFVLAGFTAGDQVGVPPWVVAAAAVVALVALTRHVPWTHVPVRVVVLTLSLGVLVAAAVPHLGLDHVLPGSGVGGDLRAFGFGSLASIASNNLPATLAGLGALGHRQQVWALLVGVNMGPLLVSTASLSTLLWHDTATGLGVHVSHRQFTRVGLRVGLPAMLAALAVIVLSSAVA